VGGSGVRDEGSAFVGHGMPCPYTKKARRKGRALSRVSRDARKLAQQKELPAGKPVDTQVGC